MFLPTHLSMIVAHVIISHGSIAHSGDYPGQSKEHITKPENLVKTPTGQGIEI